MRLGDSQKKTYNAGIATAAVTETTVVIIATGRLGTQLASAATSETSSRWESAARVCSNCGP